MLHEIPIHFVQILWYDASLRFPCTDQNIDLIFLNVDLFEEICNCNSVSHNYMWTFSVFSKLYFDFLVSPNILGLLIWMTSLIFDYLGFFGFLSLSRLPIYLAHGTPDCKRCIAWISLASHYGYIWLRSSNYYPSFLAAFLYYSI